ADEQIIGAAHIGENGVIDFIAGNAQTAAGHNATQRNHRHFGGAATDIDHHRSGGFAHWQSSADGGGHGFFDGARFTSASGHGSFDDGAFFHFGDAGRNAHHNARKGKSSTA